MMTEIQPAPWAQTMAGFATEQPLPQRNIEHYAGGGPSPRTNPMAILAHKSTSRFLQNSILIIVTLQSSPEQCNPRNASHANANQSATGCFANIMRNRSPFW